MKNKIVNNSEGKDYTTGCLLDYGYIQSHYKLIAVNLGRQKELDADPKAIEEIEFVGQLKNINGINADGAEFKFFKSLRKKFKDTKIEFS